MLIMLIVWGLTHPPQPIQLDRKPTTWLTFPHFYSTFEKKLLKTGEMLIMLVMFLKKVAKTGEMLIMLIMLGTYSPPTPSRKQETQHLKNISLVLQYFWEKKWQNPGRC